MPDMLTFISLFMSAPIHTYSFCYKNMKCLFFYLSLFIERKQKLKNLIIENTKRKSKKETLQLKSTTVNILRFFPPMDIYIL